MVRDVIQFNSNEEEVKGRTGLIESELWGYRKRINGEVRREDRL